MNFLKKVIGIAIDVVIILIAFFIIVWLLSLIGFIVPAVIIGLLKILLVLYIIAALLNGIPVFNPWFR